MILYNNKYLFIHICMAWLLVSCTSASQKFKDKFNPKYQSRDQGGLNATVTGTACSMTTERAEDSAKKAAEYHLRSLLGNERYLINFKTIRQFREGDKFCFEIQGKAQQL